MRSLSTDLFRWLLAAWFAPSDRPVLRLVCRAWLHHVPDPNGWAFVIHRRPEVRGARLYMAAESPWPVRRSLLLCIVDQDNLQTLAEDSLLPQLASKPFTGLDQFVLNLSKRHTRYVTPAVVRAIVAHPARRELRLLLANCALDAAHGASLWSWVARHLPGEVLHVDAKSHSVVDSVALAALVAAALAGVGGEVHVRWTTMMMDPRPAEALLTLPGQLASVSVRPRRLRLDLGGFVLGPQGHAFVGALWTALTTCGGVEELHLVLDGLAVGDAAVTWTPLALPRLTSLRLSLCATGLTNASMGGLLNAILAGAAPDLRQIWLNLRQNRLHGDGGLLSWPFPGGNPERGPWRVFELDLRNNADLLGPEARSGAVAWRTHLQRLCPLLLWDVVRLS